MLWTPQQRLHKLNIYFLTIDNSNRCIFTFQHTQYSRASFGPNMKILLPTFETTDQWSPTLCTHFHMYSYCDIPKIYTQMTQTPNHFNGVLTSQHENKAILWITDIRRPYFIHHSTLKIQILPLKVLNAVWITHNHDWTKIKPPTTTKITTDNTNNTSPLRLPSLILTLMER